MTGRTETPNAERVSAPARRAHCPATSQVGCSAGGNGAGKSSFYRTRFEPLGLPFLNADILARELFPESPEAHSYEAALVAAELRARLLREGRSFCFETVFSHPSKIDFVAQAKALGYETLLVFVHLDSVTLNQARIAQRVAEGGHHIPSDKVAARIQRLLGYVKDTLPLCDRADLLDNSRADDPFVQVATVCKGTITKRQDVLPDWAEFLLDV